MLNQLPNTRGPGKFKQLLNNRSPAKFTQLPKTRVQGSSNNYSTLEVLGSSNNCRKLGTWSLRKFKKLPKTGGIGSREVQATAHY